MTEEDDIEMEENQETEIERTDAEGFKCVNCEAEVDLDPVEDKIICPKCSHRVLLKKRPETPKTVEAV